MRSIWSFQRYGARHWQLAVVDADDLRATRWAPGYVSADLGDILRAAWYLTGSGRLTYGLGERERRLLDAIRESVPSGIRESL